MYYIVEIQKNAEGVYAHLVHTAQTRNEGESVYFQVLSAAAISKLPLHSVILFTDRGALEMSRYYLHNTENQEPALE